MIVWEGSDGLQYACVLLVIADCVYSATSALAILPG